MNNTRLNQLIEIAVAVAMSVVLGKIILFQLPQGGGISLEMLPIFLISLRRGVAVGIATGVLSGVVQLMLGATIVHPIEFLLDYPVAFGVLGISGIFANAIHQQKKQWKKIGLITASVFIGALFRLIAHIISGVVFFGSSAPKNMNLLLYSFIYNASFLVPSLALVFAVVIITNQFYPKLISQ